MTDIILNELNQFVDQGPSAENLNKVKEFMLKKYKENAKENSYWVNILGEYFWEGTDMKHDLGRNKIIQAYASIYYKTESKTCGQAESCI